MSKTLVIFYSRTGRTKTIAERVSELLNCELEEVVDLKKRTGILGFLRAGKDAFLKKKTIIKEPLKNPGEYDLLIIGSPVWAGNLPPAIRTYIDKFTSQLPRLALIGTCSGKGNSSKIAVEIEKISGKKLSAIVEVTAKEVSEKKYEAKIQDFINKLKAL
ncbi:MAG: NAD(P)H-dependent oxidoreductase [Candidatus Odinarchaeum yellowstonii]|uniref:NAD(P)H-dependent oxidoreductase n=1 Tax=Odinarchaeota yellowstonii (strain LCB_4) TaxID=1841599 RepID=A0AAF0D2H2_ODILC|nr:MAG: NAD(P)H-dependent oxidoreductase [Candidatus Odinarchaeum yellowstonii]